MFDTKNLTVYEAQVILLVNFLTFPSTRLTMG